LDFLTILSLADFVGHGGKGAADFCPGAIGANPGIVGDGRGFKIKNKTDDSDNNYCQGLI